MTTHHRILRPDNKGRITLGSLAEGISGFTVSYDKHQRIILEPYIEIPAREKWLFDNKAALKQVKQGLKDVSQGKLKERGSFTQYLDDEIE